MIRGLGATPLERPGGNGPVPVRGGEPRRRDDLPQLVEVIAREDLQNLDGVAVLPALTTAQRHRHKAIATAPRTGTRSLRPPILSDVQASAWARYSAVAASAASSLQVIVAAEVLGPVPDS